MEKAKVRRLDYIDWMRGLACVLMFQTHAYDSWLGGAARQSSFFGYSQLLGSLPAPLFLFLAGISLALGAERLESKGMARLQISRSFLRRGSLILGAGLIFRLQEYLISYPWAPWTDLLRVDILNVIGLGLMACAVVSLMPGRRARVVFAVACAAAIALATPPLYSTHRPLHIPWWLASYINGGHTEFRPGWLFAFFPWVGFTFAGAAAGFVLLRMAALKKEVWAFPLTGALGAVLWLLARWLDALPVQVYSVYNYWLTSPNYFLARVGVMLMLLSVAWMWCKVKPGWVWGPLIQLGKTSLLVYWVHIEFVYGRFSILPKHANPIGKASWGLAIITVAMLLLSVGRTITKGKGAQYWRMISPLPRAKSNGLSAIKM